MEIISFLSATLLLMLSMYKLVFNSFKLFLLFFFLVGQGGGYVNEKLQQHLRTFEVEILKVFKNIQPQPKKWTLL